MTFDGAFERTVGIEGGYVNDPQDPGGETQWGITWPALREAIALQLVPAGVTIKDLTRDQAKAIYRALFWERGSMDRYDPAVSFQVFDAAVNHGIPNALRMLQKAAGVADDGHIGPVTIEAVKSTRVATLLMLFIAARLEFWTKCKAWPHDGRGWTLRAVADLRFAASDELSEVSA